MTEATLISRKTEPISLETPPPAINEHSGPPAPAQIEETGVEPQELRDLVLRMGATVPSFTSEQASGRLCLPLNVIEELCWQLKQDHLLEVLGQKSHFNHSYAVTNRGREHAARLMEICGYIGPAPVSLAAYSKVLRKQREQRPEVFFDEVEMAVSDLVLPREALEVAALSVASGRSLFLFGPAGNGKTSLGRLLHRVANRPIWIPYCISVGGSIIRLYDPQVHQMVEETNRLPKFDRRWVLVQQPFVIAGGEMTIEELDLIYSRSLRFYEAPPHVKANGGTLLIDDFGRQRVDPHDLLNRWIIPLESQTDHLTLHTGQKIEIPFQLMLIVATNLNVADVADPAFLRRMGYRLYVDHPSPDNYIRIFEKYAQRYGLEVLGGVIQSLLDRYREEDRPLRASEPRDLIERVRDICRLRRQPLVLTQDVIDVAWRGYFGNAPK